MKRVIDSAYGAIKGAGVGTLAALGALTTAALLGGGNIINSLTAAETLTKAVVSIGVLGGAALGAASGAVKTPSDSSGAGITTPDNSLSTTLDLLQKGKAVEMTRAEDIKPQELPKMDNNKGFLAM